MQCLFWVRQVQVKRIFVSNVDEIEEYLSTTLMASGFPAKVNTLIANKQQISNSSFLIEYIVM